MRQQVAAPILSPELALPSAGVWCLGVVIPVGSVTWIPAFPIAHERRIDGQELWPVVSAYQESLSDV